MEVSLALRYRDAESVSKSQAARGRVTSKSMKGKRMAVCLAMKSNALVHESVFMCHPIPFNSKMLKDVESISYPFLSLGFLHLAGVTICPFSPQCDFSIPGVDLEPKLLAT